MNYYNNLAVGKWGLLMDEITYDGKDMSKGVGARIGFIDSGNATIQVPQKVYRMILHEMRKNEISVISSELDQQHQLIARKSCHALAKVLKPISFKLQNTAMTITPQGYLYNLQGSEKDCFIGISEIPDKSNQYRLGTIFLRNFYTALDYDENLIIMGVNKNIPERDRPSMEGTVLNPNTKTSSHKGFIVWIFVILTILFGIAIAFYIKANKDLQKTNETQYEGPEEEEQPEEQKSLNYLKETSKKNKNLTVQQDNDLDESLAESVDEE